MSVALDRPGSGRERGEPADRGAALAARWEERLYRSAHPLAYPALCAARKPVQRVPGVGVVVTDAALLRKVLVDPATFSKKGRGASSDIWTPVLGPTVLVNMDGADHGVLRRSLAPLFTPAWVDELSARTLTPVVAGLTARLAAGEPVDIVAEVRRYASIMISQLVGLPGDVVDDALFRRISTISAFVNLARTQLTTRQIAAARAVVAELDASAKVAYAADESTVPGRMRALGLSEKDALGAVGAFVLTGTETLVAYIPRMVALLLDTGWMSRLKADRSLIEPALAEGLRVTTPTPVMLRSVIQPGAIGRVAVKPGDRVILATFAANRALGRFDPERNAAASLKQLWFGAGPHFCIGAPLAMAQVRLVTAALLDSPGELRVVSRVAARRVLLPGYRSLVVQVD